MTLKTTDTNRAALRNFILGNKYAVIPSENVLPLLDDADRAEELERELKLLKESIAEYWPEAKDKP